MPDDTQIQKYSHTINPDGADGEKSGNGKAAISLEKDAGNTIETGQSEKGDSLYNNYNTEQWGKDNQILELPEDKDNTTDDEWYEEGVILECHIDHYSNENGSIDEDDEYADIDAYRKAKGTEKILDPRRGIPLNTIAISRTNILGLENIDFVGRSSSVRKAMNGSNIRQRF